MIVLARYVLSMYTKLGFKATDQEDLHCARVYYITVLCTETPISVRYNVFAE